MKTISIALGYAFCWGVGLSLSKIALAGMSATTLLIIQLLASVSFLFAICYLKVGKIPLSWSSIKNGRAGIFEPALAYMFGTIGLRLTSATNASLIGSSEVVLTILFAALFLGEKLTKTKLLLALMSVSGVFLIVGKDERGMENSSAIGDIIVAIGVLFAVIYVLVSKKQIVKVSPLELTTSQQFVGLIVSTIAFGFLSLFSNSYEVNATEILPQFWLLAIASGIMQYALAFLLYLTALNKVPVSQAAFYVALIPVFGVTSAIVLLGEQPSMSQWFGAALVIAASYFANKLQTA